MKNTIIECYSTGTEVILKNIEITGYVTAINIRDNLSIAYEISYFSNGEYNQNYFSEYEFTTECKNKITVGIK